MHPRMSSRGSHFPKCSEAKQHYNHAGFQLGPEPESRYRFQTILLCPLLFGRWLWLAVGWHGEYRRQQTWCLEAYLRARKQWHPRDLFFDVGVSKNL